MVPVLVFLVFIASILRVRETIQLCCFFVVKKFCLFLRLFVPGEKLSLKKLCILISALIFSFQDRVASHVVSRLQSSNIWEKQVIGPRSKISHK